VYCEVAHAHGIGADVAQVEKRFRAAFAARSSRPRTNETAERAFWRELVGEVFTPWADEAQADRLFPELWETFAESRRWIPDTALPDLFHELRQRDLRLAILSNWDSRLHRVVAGLGWKNLLDHVLLSSELGAEKPAATVFSKAACILELEPEQILHVGDSWEQDVAGALSAGWSAAWLTPAPQPAPDPRAIILPSLSELTSILA
jgi:putative hydrolase of the HAD superfamily